MAWQLSGSLDDRNFRYTRCWHLILGSILVCVHFVVCRERCWVTCSCCVLIPHCFIGGFHDCFVLSPFPPEASAEDCESDERNDSYCGADASFLASR